MLLTKLSILLGTALICAVNVPFEQTKVIDYQEQSQSEVFYHRNMQHSEMLNNYTKVTYKYETNEVNSINDIVVGNIYEFCKDDVDIALYEIGSNYSLEFVIVSGSLEFTNISSAWIDDGDYPLILTENYRVILTNLDDEDNPDAHSYIGLSDFGSTFLALYIDSSVINVDNLVIQIVSLTDYDGASSASIYSNYFSYTDYNEILSVEYVQPQTIVGVINEFCENYLFSEIPFVQSMTFEIGGQSINLMTYLVILVGLAVGIGLLILLFFLFKWLFYLFGSIFKKV